MPVRSAAALLAVASIVVAACAPGPTTAPVSATPTQTPPTQAPPTVTSVAVTHPPIAESPTSPEVTPNPVGFAFAADDVLAYYAGVGYSCSGGRPSTSAAGYAVRTCQLVDKPGRTLTVGFVTSTDGALGNAFASVQAAAGVDVLEPVDALDPLSGFLGAMLGGDRGGALIEWLAGHAGDAYAETSAGGLRIATYTPSADDHSVIYVELANQAYLAAPRPSG
ncbi:MAG: hypothetical protein ACYDAN_05495 [Candidatus Limnocylindrales bacterium]